jgi:PAS domain S-box-containing protein
MPALGTALAYALAGGLALLWLSQPAHASPMFPAAGIALACALRYRALALPGVAIGAFAVGVLGCVSRGIPIGTAASISSIFALGATLQAALGAALVRRYLPGRLTLDKLRDVAMFFALGGLLACLVGATLSTVALGVSHALASEALAATWWTWWFGDVIGVLTAAPIALTLIGRPRSDWEPRRATVGLTLFLVTLLAALAHIQLNRWDDDRARSLFEREATNATTRLVARLEDPMDALRVLRGAFSSASSTPPDSLRRAVRDWLAAETARQALDRSVWSVGYSQWVRRSDIPALEARQRAAGTKEFHVFDAQGSTSTSTIADESAMVIMHIEPLASNARAIGLNQLSLSAVREAIDRARQSDEVAATAGVRLPLPTTDETGVGLVYPLYRGEPATPQGRLADTAGLVFVTLRPEAVLGEIGKSLPKFLHLCVVDADVAAERRVLAGSGWCTTTEPDALVQVNSLSYAGRQWDIRASADPRDLPMDRRADLIPISLIELLAAAMLGALLLTVTGQTRLIEAAVHERTAELEREIREREQTESALRESEQRFRNILNHVPIGIIYSGLNGRVMQTNPALCKMLGYSSESMLGMAMRDYTHPQDWPKDIELQDRLIAGEFPMYRRQKRLLASGARPVWVQISVSLLRDAAGEPHRIVAVVENITEHLRLADAERARELAESSIRTKNELLSRMSHELRTPLNAMLGFAQLLELDRRQPLTDAQRLWVSQIQTAGWHLLEMINDVLDLSRIDSNTLRLEPVALEVAGLVASARSMTEGAAALRSIAVTQDLAADAPTVLGDATRVKQILTNLLSNAVKYNVDRGRVHIVTRSRGDEWIEFVVIDSGLGMTEEQLASLFQPFNRLGRERSEQQGTGIGLVVSRHLAELMGGTLSASSVAGEGSTFVLALPRRVNSDAAPTALPHPTAPALDYGTRVVQCVEDNEINVEVIRGILAQREQVRLEVSATGLDALAAIRRHRPDLILLDMHLPDIDGLELLRRLNAETDTAGIPVIVVSADALPAQVDAALQAGALKYLTKPVGVDALLAAIDEVLAAAKTDFG